MELDTPKKLHRYLEGENITSVLNKTKWDRLFIELKAIGCKIDFQRKNLDEEFTEYDYWNSDLYYMLGGWEYIEWLNIRALTFHRRGALVKPKVEDNIQLLLKALSNSGIPYCMHNDGVRVYGYLRPGISPEWAHT